MATTTPDNIWTPDGGDDYDLTVDLAATASSIQAALNNKAPNSLTPRVDALESAALKTARGTVNGASMPTSESARTVSINFASAGFTQTPAIIIVDQYIRWSCSGSASSTTTGQIQYANYSGATGTSGSIGWIAIGY